MIKFNSFSRLIRIRNNLMSTIKETNEESICQLKEKKIVNHDSYIFRFAFKDGKKSIGLKTGQHIKINLKINEDMISRKYTPIRCIDGEGYFDLLLKIYRKTEKFPNGGLVTSYLETLKIGDTINISEPQGNLIYNGEGHFLIGKIPKEKTYSKLGMIAGGSGITPMYQLIQKIGDNLNDKTKSTLLYANKKKEDILLYKELEYYSNNNKLNVFYTLDNPEESWQGLNGFVTKEMIEKIFGKPDSSTLICLCGPPPMIKSALNNLVEIGYDISNLYKF